MSERKRFGILKAMKTFGQGGQRYAPPPAFGYLAEVAEAVEELQTAVTELADKMALLDDAAVLQGSRIAQLEGRIDALQGTARNTTLQYELLDADLSDMGDRVAALEHHIQEDHVTPPEEGLCQEPARALSLRARVEMLEHRTRALIRQGGATS